MDVALQEFEFTIQHRPGTQHAIADRLSKPNKHDDDAIQRDDDFPDADILQDSATTTQEEKNFPDQRLIEMTYFLTSRLAPPQLRTDKKKGLTVRSRNFYVVEGVWQYEKDTGLREAHYGTVGGHYAGDGTTRKVWQAGLWWPTTQKDAYQYCKECDLC